MNGRPLVLNWHHENLPAIVEAWQLGTQSGNAIAQVLYGDYNPSGKLPMSFPRAVGQVPIYYNYKNTGRPAGAPGVFWSHYEDEKNSPLYPFGFGLSYTEFEYSEIKMSSNSMTLGSQIEASVVLKNTGKVKGKEVVQMYIHDQFASVTRPVRELKGFELVELGPGESKKVSFTIDPELLEFYSANRKWESEPGAFTVYIGTNSATKRKANFSLN